MRVGIDCRKIADYGIGTYIRGLLRALVALGTNDEYVAFAPERAPVPKGVEHVVVDAPHYSVRELVTVGRAVDRSGIEIFHAPHYVLPFTRCPAVVTIHDLIHLHQPMRNPIARMYARTMIGRAVRDSAAVLTVTEAVKADIVSTFRCEASRITVTPNGVDDRFSPSGRKSTDYGRYFLFVGNDKPHKNVDRLAAAFATLHATDRSLQLVLCGASFDRLRGKGLVTSGFVGDEALSSLYRGAIALVMPSIEEGFGLPALEAMACGTAVITSEAAALVEVTGDAALHVDATSIEEIGDAMRLVANDAALRASLVARGRQRALDFTWKRCAESTRAAYERSISR